MRKALLWLGVLLALGAAGLFVQRWIVEPVKHGRYGQSRIFTDQRWTGRDGGGQRSSGRRDRGVSSLQVFEIAIDLLNVVVGVVGIWQAVLGMRLHRANDPGRAGSRVPHS
ncbi:MAG: hypothetical protein ACKVP3_03610 [Hyphomicrobiaceae bacterium]